jgi:chromosome segregation ATPase
MAYGGMTMKKENLEILLEDIDSKFDLVLEGYAALDRKIDVKFDTLNEKIEHNSFMIDTLNKKIDAVDERLSKKIDAVDEKLSKKIDAVDEKLSKKIDAVAADLKAHRGDTEAHRGVYRVKEG